MKRDRAAPEATLGATLAETRKLNSPGHRAGRDAAEAVRRAAATGDRRDRNRRHLRIALIAMTVFFGVSGWLVWRVLSL